MSEIAIPFVSVIIPVYNDPERLKVCLQALEDQTYPKNSYEVIVIDNRSDESIEPIIAEYSQAKLDYEMYPSQFAARNKALLLAQGEFLAFTDADCIPSPDWIERGVKRLLNTPNCGIIGGKVNIFFKDPDHPTAVELYDRMTYLNQKSHIENSDFAATANIFTFKHVFEHVGNFDSSLKSGGDKNWGNRVASFGYNLVYADEVQVSHPARYTLAELLTKERRVAKGIAIVNRNWKKKVPPLVWNYESIMAHLPPLPPVIKVMRLPRASFKTKMMIIGLWLAVRYIRIEEKWRGKFGSIIHDRGDA